MLLSIVYFSVMAALGSALLAALGGRHSSSRLSGNPVSPRYSAIYRYSLFILLGVSGLGALWAGANTLLGGAVLTDILPLGLPWLHWHIRLDPLSGFFLCILGLPLLAVSLYGPGYIREFESGKHGLSPLGVFTGLFVAGMELVLLADDAFLFMIAWELMSVASYFLVAYQHEHAENRRAAFLYLLMVEIGSIIIILAFGVLAGFGNGLTFDALRGAEVNPPWGSIAFVLALIGFGMKAGLVPVHAWLPEAYPVTPSHLSALMSGVMAKIAVYGFIRFTFDLLGQAVLWQWGVLVLIIGAASALLGILYALQQQNLKRLLAYSSIENMGIIFIALGLAMIFLSSGKTVLGTVGLVAALLHCLNHALFKTLLFLGSGIILHQTHEHSLEKMGGLIHRMPKLAGVFLVGTLSIAALPPLNGFVSEWMIFKTALRASELESGILRSLIPTASAVLALTSALAATCFVKVYGVAFLGRARSHHVAKADEIQNWGMLAGPGLLAVCCILLGLLPTPVINAMASMTKLLTGATLPNAAESDWLWLTPISSSYSPIVLSLYALTMGGITYFLLSLRAGLEPRRAEPWDCGFGGLDASMQYTSGAFSMPIRRIFKAVFKVEESLDIKKLGPAQTRVTSLSYRFHIIDRAWLAVYEPVGWAVTRLAQWLGRLQTGNIRTYLGYSFFTLLLLLWVIS
jgi:hydrogenase-4 component B